MDRKLLDAKHAEVSQDAQEKIRKIIAGVGVSDLVTLEPRAASEPSYYLQESREDTAELPNAS